MMPVALATEDEVSEAVGEKLISEHPVFAETQPMLLRRNGFGYLRSRMDSWRQMAERQVVIVLTDLDRQACPLVLLGDWLAAGRQPPRNLLLRIAVREVESWLLADHEALKNLFGRQGQFPVQPDTLPDPKQYLLGLAQRAHRTVRDDLVAQQGAVARQGIGYNRRLVNWVQAQWSPERAATRSPSLLRARKAIREAAHRAMQAQ
ncbi:hypothetical protein AD950_01560 [Gluconobacter oxydans]|uniref:hypothetical protein n=1 Tax=Gluconobacter oxydans TaxID=442 RepID=UPI000781027B|nr:hypothetical protein AD950_01560 [Gluconobacter oxydans]